MINNNLGNKIKDIYKFNSRKFVLRKKDKILCAKFRKGHFEGVLNVMNRLMSIIKSKDLYMGEKDYQQLYLIKKFLSKKFRVRINSCPTIRIKNNIALSTRNKLLNKKFLKKASEIAIILRKLKRHILLRGDYLLDCQLCLHRHILHHLQPKYSQFNTIL